MPASHLTRTRQESLRRLYSGGLIAALLVVVVGLAITLPPALRGGSPGTSSTHGPTKLIVAKDGTTFAINPPNNCFATLIFGDTRNGTLYGNLSSNMGVAVFVIGLSGGTFNGGGVGCGAGGSNGSGNGSHGVVGAYSGPSSYLYSSGFVSGKLVVSVPMAGSGSGWEMIFMYPGPGATSFSVPACTVSLTSDLVFQESAVA